MDLCERFIVSGNFIVVIINCTNTMKIEDNITRQSSTIYRVSQKKRSSSLEF